MNRRPLINTNAAATGTPAPQNDYEQIRKLILIDKSRLDEAIIDQAKVFLEVCERHVKAVSVRDAAKDELARKDSEIARKERDRRTVANEKVTDSIITDHVLLHPEHIRLSAEVSTTAANADRWYALRGAFDHRMRMLRELVSLYASGYWTNSGTVGPRGIAREALADMAKEKLATARDARRTSS